MTLNGSNYLKAYVTRFCAKSDIDLSLQEVLKPEELTQEGRLEALICDMSPVSREGDEAVTIFTNLPDSVSRSGILAKHRIVSLFLLLTFLVDHRRLTDNSALKLSDDDAGSNASNDQVVGAQVASSSFPMTHTLADNVRHAAVSAL